MVNPLDANKSFPNPLVVFYSLTAILFFIFGINPLTGWALFALINGLIVCILIYLISRKLGAGLFASCIAMLSVPLITNGTNAPGIWFFVPFIGSITVVLAGILLTLNKKTLLSMLAYAFSLMLYPPMILFVVPAIVGSILHNTHSRTKIFLAGLGALICGSGLISIFLSQQYGWNQAFHLLTSWIIRQNLDGGIPLLSIWYIIPIPLPIIAAIGIIISAKNKIDVLLLPLFVGLVMWVVYAYIPQTFIIDYSRVVVITSILLMPFIGLGTDKLFFLLSKLYSYTGSQLDSRLVMTIKLIIIFFFLILASKYPSSNNWSKLVLPLKI